MGRASEVGSRSMLSRVSPPVTHRRDALNSHSLVDGPSGPVGLILPRSAAFLINKACQGFVWPDLTLIPVQQPPKGPEQRSRRGAQPLQRRELRCPWPFKMTDRTHICSQLILLELACISDAEARRFLEIEAKGFNRLTINKLAGKLTSFSVRFRRLWKARFEMLKRCFMAFGAD